MSFPFDLTWYMKRYDGFFDQQFCESVVKELDSLDWNKHQYFTQESKYITHDDDLEISYATITQKNIINECIKSIVDKYIFYDLPQEFKWFKNYHGFTTIRFNKYETGTLMRPHCDHIHDIFDGERKGIPILTVLGALNDDYEGGDLIMWGNTKIEFKAGTILVFPSNFMYPHCITKVLAGTRYSFVSWVW